MLVAACLFAPTASATRGSILPTSYFRTSGFGAGAFPADVRFVGQDPCALVGGTTAAKADVTWLACGRRLQRRATIDVAAGDEYPIAMDVTGDWIDVVGWTESSGPYLVRVDTSGVPRASFGAGGLASLASLAPSGHRDITLGAVDGLADGSVMVAGTATTGSTGDLVAFVAKVTPTGVLDPTFGAAGVREIRVPSFARSRPNDIRVLADGTILVVGWSSTAPDATFYAFAALLDAAGSFVPGFGSGGISRPLPNAATSLYGLPDGADAATWPMLASGSSNTKGSVKPFVVQIQQDGRLFSTWGGPASHKMITLTGHPRMSQGMDIERLPDGTAVGAAEMQVNGEHDSFVTRFKALSGSPDRTWSVEGLEPIDTVPGAVDGEWTSALTLSPDGQPWVVGASRIGRTDFVHLFRVRNSGPLRVQTWAAAGVVALSRRGVQRCGATARRACVVRRGAAVRVAASAAGWDPTGSPLLRPVLRVWSKPPRKAWAMREQAAGRPVRSGGHAVIFRSLRLGVGMHEVYVHRNGGASSAPAWGGPLHLRVP